MDFEYIRKVIETDGSLKICESSDNMLVITKEDISEKQTEIKDLLSTFGITADDTKQVNQGTEIYSKNLSANKLQLLLSPFIDMCDLEVKDSYTLIIRGLYINFGVNETKEIENKKVEEDSLEAGEEVIAVQEQMDRETFDKTFKHLSDSDREKMFKLYAGFKDTDEKEILDEKDEEIKSIETLAKMMDESITCDIKIISNELMESNYNDELYKFLEENESKFNAFNVKITNENISYKIK